MFLEVQEIGEHGRAGSSCAVWEEERFAQVRFLLESTFLEDVRRGFVIVVTRCFKALDSGKACKFHHRPEGLRGETLAPGILSKGIAGDGAGGRLEGKAGAAEERFGTRIQGEGQVRASRPALPF